MDPGAIRERAAALPPEPGVYTFLARAGAPESATTASGGNTERDATGESARGNRLSGSHGLERGRSSADERVLYVGKAVELADRVSTYADPGGQRMRQMVDRAEAIEVAVTDTETQALLLEANLIKRHQPRYNVRLKDDKSYPLVELTDHDAPRIEITRDPDDDATVYGPFTDKGRLETVLKALRETYGLRGCSDHKYANRERPCLDYDIGLCSAPCTGEIGPEDYAADVESVRRFFAGETGVLADPLEAAMDEAAGQRQFERAANLRDRLEAVESFHGKGGAAVAGPEDEERHVDVLGVSVTGGGARVARLHAEDGQLVERERHRLDAPDGDAALDVPTPDSTETRPSEGARDEGVVLGAFIAQYYAERPLPDTILCSHRPVDDEVFRWLEAEGVGIDVPGTGREATLVELALKNARRRESAADEPTALADALDLDRCSRIEGFDVSHAGGRDVVGSNVVFVDGSAEKRDYRRKKLPEDNDDYAAMETLIGWRAGRAVAGRDDRPDPDLLLIDGGDGQLSAARAACAEHGWEVPTVALAKEDERVRTTDGETGWDADTPQVRLLRRVRDEAHRFAVQYHETLRDDVSTVLEDLDGVGPATRRRLLRRFGSVDGVRAASETELQQVEGVGATTARSIDRQLGAGTS